MTATMRLLVVEDEQRLAAGLRKGLEAEGFTVDVAHNGTDGIWMARENPFDAIILDVMLPGANGYQVCRTLRGEGNWTPILMLTAKDGVWDEVEGLFTGADDYLAKPFSYAVLIARLRALRRRGVQPRPTVLKGRRTPIGSGDARSVARRRADRPDPTRVRDTGVPAAPYG
jgi:DNA-binding response OmpR family regulator